MKTLKKFILPLCMALFVALSFSLAYIYYLTDVPDKQKSSLINDGYDTELSLPSGQEASQVYELGGPIGAVGFKVNVSDPWDEGSVRLLVTDDDTGEVLADRTFLFYEISDTYTVTGLATEISDYEKHNIKISLTPDYPNRSAFSLSVKSTDEEKMTVSGQGYSGMMPLLVANDRLGASPLKLYVFLGALARVMCVLVCFALAWAKDKKSKAGVVFAAVLAMGIFFQIACPPFSAPDELSHYNSAYLISNKIMGTDKISSGSLMKRVTDIQPQFTDYRTTAYTYKYILNHCFDKTDRQSLEIVRVSEEFLTGYSLPRLVTAVGITLSRLLKLNGILTAYFARFLNLLVYAGIVALAYYLMPIVPEGLFAIAILPISLHMGGSFSYDSLIISMAMLLLATCLNCKFADSINLKKVLFLAVLCFLIAPLKSAYFLLPLAVLIIPGDKLTGNLKYTKPAVIVSSIAHFLYYNFWHMRFVRYKNSERISAAVSGQTATAVRTEGAAVVNFTVGYLLSHPGVFAKLLINTFFENFTGYVGDLFGRTLGYVNLAQIDINPVIIAGFAALVFFSFIKNSDDNRGLKLTDNIILGRISLLTVGMIVGACITWTPVTYSRIWGFQSRYVLPVLPMILLWLNNDRLQKKSDGFGFIISAALTLNVLAVINSMLVIFSR